MKPNFLQQAYLVLSMASTLGAFLLGWSVYAEESEELEESPHYRSSRFFVDMPVLVKEGVEPFMPLNTRPAPIYSQDDPAFDQRRASIQQYANTVADIELEGGAWHSSLVEELFSLGRLQQQQGDHKAAAGTFDRAVHIHRINFGLNNLEQVPVVEQLIQSQMALGDWEQVDTYNKYLFHVQQKAYDAHDPRLLPVLDRLATWNVQAYKIGHGELRGVRLRESQILFNAAARMVSTHFGNTDQRYLSYLKNIVNTAFYAASNPGLMSEIYDLENQGRLGRLAEKLQIRGKIGSPGFRTGEKALMQIAMFHYEQGENSYDHAEAITHLADWYLLFDRPREALEKYKTAWSILQELENNEELTGRLFGDVVPVPLFTSSIGIPDAFYNNGNDSEPLKFDYADLVFDVTTAGLVRNIELITEKKEEHQVQLNKLRRFALSMRFRPRIVEGVPQHSSGNHFRYRYWY